MALFSRIGRSCWKFHQQEWWSKSRGNDGFARVLPNPAHPSRLHQHQHKLFVLDCSRCSSGHRSWAPQSILVGTIHSVFPECCVGTDSRPAGGHTCLQTRPRAHCRHNFGNQTVLSHSQSFLSCRADSAPPQSGCGTGHRAPHLDHSCCGCGSRSPCRSGAPSSPGHTRSGTRGPLSSVHRHSALHRS